MSTHPLRLLFHPQTVTVIGASPDASRIRGRILDFLVKGEYRGRVLPVNPSYREIHGVECFDSIAAARAAVNATIDLAIVVIPAQAVLAELERCAATGVRYALIVSSGFAEEGGAQAAVQERIAAIAASTGMRVIGPNSEGFFSAVSRVRATFSPTVEAVLEVESSAPRISAKRVGVVAQSGGMGFGIMHRGHAAGLAFSHVISTGNEADLDLSDCLDFMVDDPDTDLIALYLECVRNPDRFVQACARALERDKPIVALKVGRGQAGSRATVSHTGSIAGWDAAYDAVFAKHAIPSAADMSEAISILGLLATCGRLDGNRIGVLTGSGGAGALISDVLERHGLTLPVLSAATQATIGKLLPSYASAQNPVDITAGSTRTGALVKAADVLLGCDEIDAVVSVHSLTSEKSTAFEPRELARGAKLSGKPLTTYCYTEPSRFGRGKMAEAGIYVHTDLQLMSASLAKLLLRGQRRALAAMAGAAPLDARAVETFRKHLDASAAPVLCEYEVKAALRACGIAAADEILCRSASEAVAAAERLGPPVALKIQSAQITHKTEIGGVQLAIRTPDGVRAAYGDVLAAAAEQAPQAKINGVLVQRMAPSGHEVIVGTIRDATFGPIVMVGLGGTAVGLYRDVAYWPAPLSLPQAEALLRSLKSSALFDGFRGNRAISLAPLARLVSQVSHLVATQPNEGRVIAELELNPVIVHADGSGLTIADALLRLA